MIAIYGCAKGPHPCSICANIVIDVFDFSRQKCQQSSLRELYKTQINYQLHKQLMITTVDISIYQLL